MEEKRLVPKRRFKNLNKKWIKSDLNAMSIKIGDGIHGTPIYSNSGDVYFINGHNLKNGKVEFNSNTKKVNINQKTENDKLLNDSTILMSINGTIGMLAFYNNENIMLGKSVAYIILKDVNKEYVYYYLQKPEIYRYFIRNLTGSTIKNLGLSTIRQTKLKYPVQKEQQKIGEFFRVLDERIANQERKIAKVKALKEAYLTEMFPQEGETLPKRRFKGFEGEWEKKKVSELFKVTRGDVLSTTKVSKIRTNNHCYPVYSSQTLNDGLLGYYNKYLFDNAITWTTDGANAGTVNYREGKFYSTNVNGVLISLDGYACKAVAEALNLIAWKYVSKVGNPKLMNNVMADIELFVPKNIQELECLSMFFKNLDDQIRVEEARLEKLKKMKEAYLEEMFV